MRDIVELCDDVVKKLGSDVSVLRLDLRREVTEGDDGGLIRSDEDGSDEEFVMSHPFGVAEKRKGKPKESVKRSKIVKKCQLSKEGEEEEEEEEGLAHLGSAASNSRITRSVLSGRWCSEQKAKYDESIFLVAPLVSSEAG